MSSERTPSLLARSRPHALAVAALLLGLPGCGSGSNDNPTLETDTLASSGGSPSAGSAQGDTTGSSQGSAASATTDESTGSSQGDTTSSSQGDTTSATTGESTGSESDTASEPVTIINGSFEVPGHDPGCYSNYSNAEFNALVDDVYAFGTLDQIDLYADCYGTTTDGIFHVGLGADGSESDALALALSAPLDAGAGAGYRLRFTADHGQTGAATSTDIAVGLSNDPTNFGEELGRTGTLTDDPQEYTFEISDEGATFVTLQVVPDGDLGWAMVDAVVLEPIE